MRKFHRGCEYFGQGQVNFCRTQIFTPEGGISLSFMDLLMIDYFLGHLSHSGDLLLWVGVRRRPSSVVRRALTSSPQKLLGQS